MNFQQFYLLTEDPDEIYTAKYQCIYDDPDSQTLTVIGNAGIICANETHWEILEILYHMGNINPDKPMKLNKVNLVGNLSDLTPKALEARARKARLVFPVSLKAEDDYIVEEYIASFRTRFCDVAGRAWTTRKVMSFWNPIPVVKSKIHILQQLLQSINQDIRQYNFQFIDQANLDSIAGIFLTYDELLRSTGHSKPQPLNPEITGKLHTDPKAKREQLGMIGGSAKEALRARNTGYSSTAEDKAHRLQSESVRVG